MAVDTAETRPNVARKTGRKAYEKQLLLRSAQGPGAHAENWGRHRQSGKTTSRGHAIDWGWVMGQAKKHGIEPMLHVVMQRHGIEAPEQVTTWLMRRRRATTFHSMHQTRELRRVVERFEGRGVPVMPLKGPLLGRLAYGDASLRRSVDLDLLVQNRDFDRAVEVLHDLGYGTYRTEHPAEMAHFVEWHRSYEFAHHEKSIILELHRDFFPRIVPGVIDTEGAWERHVNVSLGGTTMRSLALEDLVIYLCAHGTRHRWAKLKWLSDLYGVLQRHSAIDWSALLERARKGGSLRMVRIGLGLAHQHLGAPLPDRVLNDVQGDSRAQRMMDTVWREWIFAFSTTEVEPWSAFWFHLRERERWQDRLPYLLHSLQLAVAPSEKDRDFLSLPDELSALYYVVRPSRIVWERLKK